MTARYSICAAASSSLSEEFDSLCVISIYATGSSIYCLLIDRVEFGGTSSWAAGEFFPNKINLVSGLVLASFFLEEHEISTWWYHLD